MSDYQAVTKALAEGADPVMLCAMCPWDRNCINPPTMTAGEIERQIAEAQAKDEAAMKADPTGRSMPAATLMTTLVYAGRDTAVQACPVFGIRLRSAGGRKLADMVRAAMQSWEES